MIPDISIVIPTFNRMKKLERCIRSIFSQNYPKEKMEIVVVDDYPQESLHRLINDFSVDFPNIIYIPLCRKGPAAARNAGVKQARGGIIAFVDDDCRLEDNWVKLMLEDLNTNSGFAASGGDTLISMCKTFVLVSQFLSTGSIETEVGGRKETIFFPTCNAAVRKEIFDVYGFNENFPLPGGEDLEFFWRIFKDGHRLIWDRRAKIFHDRDSWLGSFLKQAYSYGRGNFLVKLLHRDHPLLKELKTERFAFWVATLINIVKIPKFAYCLGNRLINEFEVKGIGKKIFVYSCLIMHKILYIIGNLREFFRISLSGKKESLWDNPAPVPRLLILDITHFCNLNCRICDIWKTVSKEKDLDIGSIKKIISEAARLGIREITLSGGEPLTRGDIFEILDFTRKSGIKNLGLLTNGLLIEEYLERLKPYLIDRSVSLVISFDSLRPEVHNYIRNSDSAWKRTRKVVNELALLKKSFPQINFNIISIVLNQNLEELPNLAEYIRTQGANSLQFQVFLPSNLRMAERKKSEFWVSGDRLQILDETLECLISFKKKYGAFIKNSISNLALMKQYYRGSLDSGDVVCGSVDQTVLISNRGICTTCFSAYGDAKSGSLARILRSKEALCAKKETEKCRWPCLLPCFCDHEL
ncbi:MAG: glycosyltransferase [Candidatus Omnitrophota bacterium]|jgi:MoaA/NifB/PqqE/SkfB family radical SAM enzyme/glycosyltransferase involved in cell wall biosynthesis